MAATHKEILSHHLLYEIGMLGEAFLRLEAGVPKEEPFLANVYIEAFSLHARNLIAFFEKELSTHYATAPAFTDASYKPLSTGIVRKELRAKLNNQLLHLTWERTVNDSEKFGPDDRRELIRVLELERAHFVAHLTQQHKSDWPGIRLPTPPA